jgi:mannose-1-phosphate guanylyltransferase
VRRWKAILLAGGLGTRLRPLTNSVPKCLVPVAGRPLLEYWFLALNRAGIRDVLINTHHLRSQVSDFIEHKNKQGWSVTEFWEPELLGSAGTINACRDWCQDADHCLIIYADNLSTVDLSEFMAFHQSYSDPFTMLLFHTPNPTACGIATVDDQQRIVQFTEKPVQPTGNLANGGVYAWTVDAYREIAGYEAFDLGFDVLPRFVGRMRGWPFSGYHLDIGTPENLAKADADAMELFAENRSE